MTLRVRRILFSVLTMLFLAMMISGTAVTAQAANTEAVYMKKTGKKAYLYYKTTNKKVTGLTGLQEFPEKSGNFYYLRDTTGRVYAACTFKTADGSYRAKSNGRLVTGWYKKGKKKYYYNTINCKLTTGWKTLSKKKYYFNSKGVMVTGFLKQGGHTYYMTPSTGIMATGLQKIGGKTYFFDTKGRMQTGIVNIGNKTCYFNASGIRKLGLITYNGKTYYFNKKNANMVTGWKTVGKKTYYFRASGTDKGAAVTGWMTLNGKTYYFNNSGVMQKGWLLVGTRKYYMDPSTGAMTTGKVTISGTKYDFGTKGYITVSASDLVSTRVKNMLGSGSGKVVLVNRGTCVITVYEGGKPVKAMFCSPGRNTSVSSGTNATPLGTRYIKDKLRWHTLDGPTYGQYCSHLAVGSEYSSYLFHSVMYSQLGNIKSLYMYEYQNLGSPASHGCIRLACGDAYYIYKNCPIGTRVVIFDGSKADDPLQAKFVSQKWDGYDPTDPNAPY